MRKKLSLLLCLLALACLLCVSVHAEEPVVVEQTCTGIIQSGGFPEAPQSGLRLYASAQSADDTFAGAKAALKQGLETFQTEIDISKYQISTDKIKSVYEQVVNENPELFFVSGTFYYSYTSSQTVTSVRPYYQLDGKEIEPEELKEEQKTRINEQRGELEAVVNEIIAQVDSKWSALEKALFLHDYLATHAQYDTGSDAYTILTKGTGVCQAYTLAYRLLLNRVRIPSGTVSSESLNHIWNLLQINDSWYHVDVTWDDPINDRIGRVRHENFCTSDEKREKLVNEAMKNEENWTFKQDWVYSPAVSASSSFDSRYWTGVDSAFVPLNGNWYYLSYVSDGSFVLMQTKDPKEAGSQNKVIDAVWQDRVDGGYWIGLFSGLSRYQNALIYNTPDTIYCYDPENGEPQELHTLTDEERAVGDIYGSVVYGDELKYTLLENPSKNWTQLYTLELDPYKAVPEGGYAYSIQGGTLSLKRLDMQPSGCVIAAWYGADSRMLGAARMETQERTLSLPKTAVTVKLFAVSQTGSIPLCKAVELSAK